MVSLNTHWQQLLWNCYHHGKDVKKDDSKIKELMGNYLFIERPQDVPLPFNKKVNSVKEFLDGMEKGLYDLPNYPIKGEALSKYVNSWNDIDKIYLDEDSRKLLKLDGKPFVYTYPERLLRKFTVGFPDPDFEEAGWFINQFDVMISRLVTNPGSNRAVATIYQPGIDYFQEDIPCLNWLQFTVRDNKLELHCVFRSNDLYGAWPSNMYLLTFLGLWMAEELNTNINIKEEITFNGIHYHSSSLHIYETDIDAVKKILGGK